MSLVVVSNRITRGNANEPITGGLAAALLPIVEKSGAIWVGSSGRVRDGVVDRAFGLLGGRGADVDESPPTCLPHIGQHRVEQVHLAQRVGAI